MGFEQDTFLQSQVACKVRQEGHIYIMKTKQKQEKT